jgi:beta-glucuronidase
VWEEALAWGNRAAQLNLSTTFMSAELGTANAMLDRDTNHPAIILWGFFNEAESDHNSTKPAYKAMADLFHTRDPTRLVHDI